MNTENSIEVFEMVKEVKASLDKDVIIHAINKKIKERKDNTKKYYEERITEELEKLQQQQKKKWFFRKEYTREQVEDYMNKNFPLKRMMKINDEKYLKKYIDIQNILIEKSEISITNLTEILGLELDIQIKNY